MLRAEECCCGCTLRTGTLILSWIWLIAGGFGILLYGSSIIHIDEIVNSSPGIIQDSPGKFGLYFNLGLSVTCFVTSILAIVGIHKDNGKYLTPYLYCKGFFILYFSLATILVIIADTRDLIAMFMVEVLMTALLVYFWIIVRSCRDTMLKNATANGNQKFVDPSANGYYNA